MGSVLSPRRRTDPMHNHDSHQLTGASPRGRSAACRRVPSHAVPCGTPYASVCLARACPRRSATRSPRPRPVLNTEPSHEPAIFDRPSQYSCWRSYRWSRMSSSRSFLHSQSAPSLHSPPRNRRAWNRRHHKSASPRKAARSEPVSSRIYAFVISFSIWATPPQNRSGASNYRCPTIALREQPIKK